jgi:hypothetical protein
MDNQHRPILMFGYASELDAMVARRLILVALEKAEFVGTLNR